MFTGSTPNRFRINRPDPRLRIDWIRRPDHVRITSGSHTGGTLDHVRTCRPPRTTGSTPDHVWITSGSRLDHVRITSGSPDDIRSRRAEHVRIKRPDVVTGMSLRITDSLPDHVWFCHFNTCRKPVTMPFSIPRTPPSQEHRQTPGA